MTLAIEERPGVTGATAVNTRMLILTDIESADGQRRDGVDGRSAALIAFAAAVGAVGPAAA